jgi:hypothetical protein
MQVVVDNNGKVTVGGTTIKAGAVRYRLGAMTKPFYRALKDRKYKGVEVQMLKGIGSSGEQMFAVKILSTGQAELAGGTLDDSIGAKMGEVLKDFRVNDIVNSKGA